MFSLVQYIRWLRVSDFTARVRQLTKSRKTRGVSLREAHHGGCLERLPTESRTVLVSENQVSAIKGICMP
jgi:hypothetical protein